MIFHLNRYAVVKQIERGNT